MGEVYSNGHDAMWLAYKLKDKMGSFVSFNKFGIDNPILTGVYAKNGYAGQYMGYDDIRFYIKFCKGEFLRIQIPLGCNKKENVIIATDALVTAISDIEDLGMPIAIYETDECLTTEYNFKDREETVEKLRTNKMFDDGDVENLNIVGDETGDIKTLCKKATQKVEA